MGFISIMKYALLNYPSSLLSKTAHLLMKHNISLKFAE